MHRVFVFVLFLAATAIAGVLDGQLSLRPENYMFSAKQRLAINMQRVCEDKSDSEIEEAIDKLVDCAGEIDFDSRTVCNLLQTEIPSCVRHITDFMAECLPERSRGLPDFVLSSVNSTVKYLCGTDGEHLLELFGNPCIFNRPSYRLNRCKNRVVSRMQRFRDQTPTTKEVCDALTSLKPCLLNHIEESCGNYVTKEAFTSLYDAVLNPCSSSESSENNNEVEKIDVVYSI